MALTADKVRKIQFYLTPILFAGAVLFFGFTIYQLYPKSSTNAQKEDVYYPVPDFRLTDRYGNEVSKADLQGKVWLASFVFTRCTGPCPSVSATMAKLQRDLDLSDRDELRLVTFTVDPERDTPDELKKYAESFQADADKWLFLTGEEEELHRLILDGFKIQSEKSQLPDPPEGQEYEHSTYLVLVDQNGIIRGYYYGYMGPNDEPGGLYDQSMNELKDKIQELINVDQE